MPTQDQLRAMKIMTAAQVITERRMRELAELRHLIGTENIGRMRRNIMAQALLDAEIAHDEFAKLEQELNQGK